MVGFKNSDLTDFYAVIFDGHVNVGTWVPLTAVGMVWFDGNGCLSVKRVLYGPDPTNPGNYQPVEQKGSGTYYFGVGGIATATLEMTNIGSSNGPPAAFSRETFRFVVNADRSELQFMSTGSIFHILGGASLQVVVRGVGQKTTPPGIPVPYVGGFCQDQDQDSHKP